LSVTRGDFSVIAIVPGHLYYTGPSCRRNLAIRWVSPSST
jgi:hypothetical protein